MRPLPLRHGGSSGAGSVPGPGAEREGDGGHAEHGGTTDAPLPTTSRAQMATFPPLPFPRHHTRTMRTRSLQRTLSSPRWTWTSRTMKEKEEEKEEEERRSTGRPWALDRERLRRLRKGTQCAL